MSLDHLKFENVVKDLTVDKGAYDQLAGSVQLPLKKYVVVFTARSGSSWLTSILSQTNKLGLPEEYLNPNFVRTVASAVNCAEAEGFLLSLQRQRQTKNGVFGLEVREVDVALFGSEIFFKCFDESTVYFNLWRDNIISQAVSLYRAVETKQYHSSDAEQASSLPNFNADSIQKWVVHLATQENANFKMLCEQKKPFYNLRYEDIVKDRLKTIKLFANILSVPINEHDCLSNPDKELKKIGNSWNNETEAKFRSERPDFVAKVEQDRLIKAFLIREANGRLFAPF